jgi:hypothetical protein
MDLLKSARDEIQSLEKTVSDALARLTDLRAFVMAAASGNRRRRETIGSCRA